MIGKIALIDICSWRAIVGGSPGAESVGPRIVRTADERVRTQWPEHRLLLIRSSRPQKGWNGREASIELKLVQRTFTTPPAQRRQSTTINNAIPPLNPLRPRRLPRPLAHQPFPLDPRRRLPRLHTHAAQHLRLLDRQHIPRPRPRAAPDARLDILDGLVLQAAHQPRLLPGRAPRPVELGPTGDRGHSGIEGV